MVDDFTTPITVEQMYGDWEIEWEDVLALADRSLDPRPASVLFEIFGALGVDQGDHVLDIGGRDSAQALVLAERFGCQVLTVDPVQANLDLGTQDIAAHDHGHLVENALGTITDIPGADGSFDAIFCRDMLGHVEDLAGALAECRRVMKPGAPMLIHDVFATPLLEPAESARLCADLAQVPERLDAELFEEIVAGSGFAIETMDPVASEPLEALLEGEDGESRLLRAARLHRERKRYVAEMGVIPYRVFLANTLWTIYRMIGKLEDRVYVIRS